MNAPSKGRIQGPVPTQQASGQNLAAQAAGNLSRSIKQTGDLALELQKEQDRQDFTDAELIMQQETTKLASDLATNMDPSTHAEEAKIRLEAATDRILQGKEYRPSFQRDLETRLNLFSEARVQKIAGDAKLMQVEIGRKKNLAMARMNQADGNWEKSRQNIRDGVGTYYSQEEADVRIADIDRDERYSGYDMMVTEGDVEGIENSDLSPSNKAKFLERAKVQRARKARKAMEEVMDKAEQGGFRSEEEMKALLDKTKDIPDAMKENVLYHWKQDQPISLEERRDLMGRMEALTEQREKGDLTEGEYEEQHHAIGLDVFAMGSRAGTAALRDELSARDPSNWNENNLKEGAERQAKATVGKLFTVWEKHKKKVLGEDYSMKDEMGVLEQRGVLEKQMNQWLIKNKDEIGKPGFDKRMNEEFRRLASLSDLGDLFRQKGWSGKLDAIVGPEGPVGGQGPMGETQNRGPVKTPAVGSTRTSSSGFKAFYGSRDQFKNWRSVVGDRKCALDFNDVERDHPQRSSVKGILIVMPRDSSTFEIRMGKKWASDLQSHYAQNGINVKILGDKGVKVGGGKKGVIHTEPFFAADSKSRDLIKNNPDAYAKILAGSLGKIPGVTFIAPHTRPGAKDKHSGEGAVSGPYSERGFAMKHILPTLMNY